MLEVDTFMAVVAIMHIIVYFILST